MSVAEAVGRALAGARRRPRLRRGRHGQLPRHQRHGRGRRPVRGRPARGRRGDHGRRVRADERHGRALTVHQGCGLTNAMTGITEAAKSRTPLVVLAAEATEPRSNFYVDQDGAGPAVGAVPMRVRRPETAVADDVRGRRHRARTQRRTVLLNLPLDVQSAGHARDRSPVPAGRHPAPARRRTRPTSPRSSAALDARPSGRCSSPAAARRGRRAGSARPRWPTGTARCSRPRRSPRAVPRRPVVAGRLRRLRLAARGRADRRRRPDRRLGLRPEHVDDAARPADRRRTRPWSRSTSTPTRSGAHRAGRHRRRRRRARDRARGAAARWPADGTRLPRDAVRAGRIAAEGRWRDVPYDDDEPATAGSTRGR